MAKETIHSERPAQNTVSDPITKTSYANNSLVIVNSADVYMYFGVQPPTDGEDVPFENRIVLTHSAFMRMMEYWVPRYRLLAEIYNGAPMSLSDFNPEIVTQAYREMLYPAPDTKAPEDDTD